MRIKYILVVTIIGIIAPLCLNFLAPLPKWLFPYWDFDVGRSPVEVSYGYIVVFSIPTVLINLFLAFTGAYMALKEDKKIGVISPSEGILAGMLTGTFLMIGWSGINLTLSGVFGPLWAHIFYFIIMKFAINYLIPCLIGGYVYDICFQRGKQVLLEDQTIKKYCVNCGTELDKKVKICPKCSTVQPLLGKVSDAWYIAPLFYYLIGGLIAWHANKELNPSKARNFLVFGIIWTIILSFTLWVMWILWIQAFI